MTSSSRRPISSRYPRLRENVWWIDPTATSGLLRTSRNQYQVPILDALRFLKIRRYCTGHHTVEDVAPLLGVFHEDVAAIVHSLDGVDLLYPDTDRSTRIDRDVVRDTFVRACDLWTSEIAWTSIWRELARGEMTLEVLLGSLVEAYHEAREFSEALGRCARDLHGPLGHVVARCVEERSRFDVYF